MTLFLYIYIYIYKASTSCIHPPNCVLFYPESLQYAYIIL